MAQAIIFDIDGTLLDSNDLHAKAWAEAFTEFGHHVAFADVRRQIGKGGDQLMPVFLSDSDVKRQGQALEVRRGEIFKERYLPKVVAFRGVRALMERLKADGASLALASSAAKDELAQYKTIAHIEDLIPTETSSDDAEKSKPHPDIFEVALQRLHLPSRRQAIVVGDTPYDAEAAVRAGVRSIGVTCGGWSSGDLRRAGCATVYESPADLLKHYGSWRRWAD
jgi:HAD superfamily hydrolase (TIGR01509 family)